MPQPQTYSELYPGRFLKADLFRGQKVTVTIERVELEILEGEKGKEPKAIIWFVGKDRQWVANKTNGFCLQRMFGKTLADWIGKRVSLYPTLTRLGRDTVDCIRVWGSPDIAGDMNITIPQGRKKPVEAVMHKVMPGECGFKGDAAPSVPAPAVTEPLPEPAEEWEEGRVYDFHSETAAQ